MPDKTTLLKIVEDQIICSHTVSLLPNSEEEIIHKLIDYLLLYTHILEVDTNVNKLAYSMTSRKNNWYKEPVQISSYALGAASGKLDSILKGKLGMPLQKTNNTLTIVKPYKLNVEATVNPQMNFIDDYLKYEAGYLDSEVIAIYMLDPIATEIFSLCKDQSFIDDIKHLLNTSKHNETSFDLDMNPWKTLGGAILNETSGSV